MQLLVVPDGQGQAATAHHDRANGAKQDTSSSVSSKSVSVVHAVLSHKHMATHMCSAQAGAKNLYMQLKFEPSLRTSEHTCTASVQLLDARSCGQNLYSLTGLVMF